MNQLCVRFPVVAAHNGTSSFAVACPETRHADARAAATAVQTPVNVYNMSTGAKMCALVLSRPTPGSGSNNGEINPLAPIVQVRPGTTALSLTPNLSHALCFSKCAPFPRPVRTPLPSPPCSYTRVNSDSSHPQSYAVCVYSQPAAQWLLHA